MAAEQALIAMSGGVDSSVAAYLMKKNGYSCVGCTMKLHANEGTKERENSCCTLEDVEDARSVAYRLDMPYYVFNFSDDFEEKIIRKFIRSYENGITPNPCIDCNRYMKFDKLFERAKVLGCEYVVTGHYARIGRDPETGKLQLKKAADASKDQSYVLYSLTQEQLRHVQFPLGELLKTEVRAIAEEKGFVNARKAESQDICFVPDGDYAKVIAQYTGKQPEPGNYVDAAGRVLGRHQGIIHYTIGQRKGLGVAFGSPRFVCGIRKDTNEVVLGTNEELFRREVHAGEFNWIAGEPPARYFRCKAKIRYRQTEQWADVTVNGNGSIFLCFDEPQRAVTPGQSAVLYDGEIVLGGGIIQ